VRIYDVLRLFLNVFYIFNGKTEKRLSNNFHIGIMVAWEFAGSKKIK